MEFGEIKLKKFMYCFRDEPWKMGVVLAETYVDACSKLMIGYSAGISKSQRDL